MPKQQLPTKSYSMRPTPAVVLRQRMDRDFDVRYDDGRIERGVQLSRIEFIQTEGHWVPLLNREEDRRRVQEMAASRGRCKVTRYDRSPTKVSRTACRYLQKVDEAIRADPSTNDKKLASVLNTLQHYQSIIPVHENAKGYAEIPKSPRHGWSPVVEKFLG